MRNGLILVLAAAVLVGAASAQTPPPAPHLPIPTARQLDWQYDELRLFLHFGVNTFTDQEWGSGAESPEIFDPANLDAAQWVDVAKGAGFRTVILTAKHHDGFALWPSRYTDHTVQSSPWRGGEGDVVGELAEAARSEDVKLGLYLSPWDRHEPSYGDEDAYNSFYMGQLRELLTGYGPLAEVWFDGAKGEDAQDMDYDFDAYWSMVRQLQPEAAIFSDEGPDVRWIGNEHGFAGETNWSTIDRSKVSVGASGIQDYLNQGERGGPDWVGGECDTSIRPGWFWHPDEEPKSLDRLLEIYFKSVGRNCVLLLNVPPNDQGRIDAADVERLDEFRAAIDQIFSSDLARGADASADVVRGDGAEFAPDRVLDGNLDTYWAVDDGPTTGTIRDTTPRMTPDTTAGTTPDTAPWTLTLELEGEKEFNVIRIQEPIAMGQRVAAYHVEAWVDREWQTVSEGTTIGHKKLDRLQDTVTSDRIRLVVLDAVAPPLIAEMGLHFDPHMWTP